MTVTRFMDMHSGGTLKTEYQYIYVEAPYEDAIDFFKSWFGEDPFAVACSCCGRNFSVDQHGAVHEQSALERATAHDRNCKWVSDDDYTGGGYYVEESQTVGGITMDHATVSEYLDRDDVTYFDQETVENELGRVVGE